MTSQENGNNLVKTNLYSLLFGKFRGLWTMELFVTSMKPVFA